MCLLLCYTCYAFIHCNDESVFDHVMEMLKGNCILAPTNKHVASINSKLIRELPSRMFSFDALDLLANGSTLDPHNPFENTLIGKNEKHIRKLAFLPII